jgi:hypothetical protein
MILCVKEQSCGRQQRALTLGEKRKKNTKQTLNLWLKAKLNPQLSILEIGSINLLIMV